MIIKTLEATYDGGALRLAEPLDLAPQSRVRVQVEIPPYAPEPPGDLLARLDEAYADAPDDDERTAQAHLARLRREQAEEW